MKSKLAMRAAAGLLTLALAAGAVPPFSAADRIPLFPAVSADAAEFSVSIQDGDTLILSGDLSDRDQVQDFIKMLEIEQIKTLKTAENTIFPADCSALFYFLPNLETADFTGADFSNVQDMTAMLTGIQTLKTVIFKDLKNGKMPVLQKISYAVGNCSALTSVDFGNTDMPALQDASSLFVNDYALTEVTGLCISSPRLRTVAQMFNNCYALPSVDLSQIRTDGVEEFNGMFNSCTALTELDLSGFSTGNAITMGSMFEYCTNLRQIDLSSFDFSKVESMYSMFGSCSSLRSVKFGAGVNTARIQDMSYMFSSCKRLRDLDLRDFTTGANTNLRNMFVGCADLTELDLRGFTVGSSTDVSGMLEGTSHLKKLMLGPGITGITKKMNLASSDFGWVNAAAPDTVLSGTVLTSQNSQAVFDNDGTNTYLNKGRYGEITGTTLTLLKDGSIGLRFYAKLSDCLTAEEQALSDVWFFIYAPGEGNSDHYRAAKDADGRYYVTVNVPAKHMADKIEADLYYYSRKVTGLDEGEEPYTGEYWQGEVDRVFYTVRNYADELLADPVKYAKEQNAVKAMLCYGGAAQRHFGNYDPNMPFTSPCADLGISYTGPSVTYSSEYVKPAPLAGLAYYGSSAVLESMLIQRHYFSLKSGSIGDYDFTAGGNTAVPVQYEDTDLYYIDSQGIPAMLLDQAMTVSAVSKTDPSKKISFRYSVLDYIRIGLATDQLTGTAAETAKALGDLAVEAALYSKA